MKQLDLELVVDEEVQSSDGEETNDLIFGQSPSQNLKTQVELCENMINTGNWPTPEANKN